MLNEVVGQLSDAVRHRDGDRIVELTERYRAISETLFKHPLDSTDAADAEMFGKLSAEVLKQQAEIQTLAFPWMDDLRLLLRENKNGQAINAAYRTEP